MSKIHPAKDIYGIVTYCNAIYIVGPVSFASPVYLNCDYNELILEEEIEKYVPQVNPDDYLEDILFLNHMITGVESTTEQIIETNCLNHDHTVKVQKHFNDILFENNENNIHHNPYDQEMREFGSIENGDLIQLEKSMQEDYDGTIGTLAKIPCAISKISVLFWSLSQAVLRSADTLSGNFLFSERFLHPTDRRVQGSCPCRSPCPQSRISIC